MNDLVQTYVWLASALQADPQLCLINTVTWLDPLWQDHDEEDIVPQDEEGTLAIALCITRKVFPDIYIQVVEDIRRGATYVELNRFICATITEYGIPLDDLEWMGYGVPMPAYGATLEDSDFYTHHPDVVPIVACFGISLERHVYQMSVPEWIYIAGRFIASDLEDHPDEPYQQIAWLMKWLFSCSGNSSVDYDYDATSEFQPLSWEKDELAYALAIIEEAEEIMSDVLTGLVILNLHPLLLQALEHNIHSIYKHLEKQKGKTHEPRLRLAWPDIADCPERTTEPVT